MIQNREASSRVFLFALLFSIVIQVQTALAINERQCCQAAKRLGCGELSPSKLTSEQRLQAGECKRTYPKSWSACERVGKLFGNVNWDQYSKTQNQLASDQVRYRDSRETIQKLKNLL